MNTLNLKQIQRADDGIDALVYLSSRNIASTASGHSGCRASLLVFVHANLAQYLVRPCFCARRNDMERTLKRG